MKNIDKPLVKKVVVAQLAKAPIAGKVKTRLMSELSAEQACGVHCYLSQRVFLNLHCSSLWSYELWVSEHHRFFASFKRAKDRSIKVVEQVSGDLGARMAAITKQHLIGQKSSISILVGSDCPFIDATLVESVISDFSGEQHDISIVPAHDGGYVLIAIRRYVPELYHGISWGGGEVLAQTVEVIKKLNLNLRLHAALSDIDRPEDLGLLSNEEIQAALSFTDFG